MAKKLRKNYTVIITVIDTVASVHAQTTLVDVAFNEICGIWRRKCEVVSDKTAYDKIYDVKYCPTEVGYIDVRFPNGKFIHMFYY